MTPKMVIVDVLLRRFGGKMIFEQRLKQQQEVGTYLMFAFEEVQYIRIRAR